MKTMMKTVSTKRERDKAVIIDLVRGFGPISRVDIHTMTGLRPGTVSSLVRELLRENKLMEVGRADNATGRKRILLDLNPNYGHVVAVEFDAEAVVTSVINLRTRVLHLYKERTNLENGVDGLVSQLVACVTRVMKEATVTLGSVVGLGVADPGLIDRRRGVSITSSTLEFWHDVPLKDIFTQHFAVPFVLESNTRARTMAERVLGAGRLAEDMVYLDYGTGIGLGVVTGGHILYGHSDSAAEFGHTHVIEGGPPCKCGSFGCLEAIVGAPAIAARVRAALEDGGNSMVTAMAGGDSAKITGFMVLEAARLGDKLCAAVVEEVKRYLGLGLANIVNLFNPSLVVLDKRLTVAGNDFLEDIVRIVNRQALRRATQDLEFRFGELGVEAGVLGVALSILEQYFEVPAFQLPKFMAESSVEQVAV